MPLELESWPCDFGRVRVGGREGVEMLRDWYENLVKVLKQKHMILWIAPLENDPGQRAAHGIAMLDSTLSMPSNRPLECDTGMWLYTLSRVWLE